MNQAVATVTLDLSGVDLSQYQALELYAVLLMGATNSNVSVLCNDITDGYSLIDGSNTGKKFANILAGAGQWPGIERLYILLGKNTIFSISQGSRWSDNKHQSYGPTGISLRLDPSQLTKLKLVGEGSSTASQILPGSEFTLYGLKK